MAILVTNFPIPLIVGEKGRSHDVTATVKYSMHTHEKTKWPYIGSKLHPYIPKKDKSPI